MKEPPHLYEYLARVVSVYDGDTIRCDINLGFNVWIHNTSVRLLGIDTPEIRGETREAGIVARDWLRARIAEAGPTVMLRTEQDKAGKYGRWLGDVHLWVGDRWESVNAMLVDQGLARRVEF